MRPSSWTLSAVALLFFAQPQTVAMKKPQNTTAGGDYNDEDHRDEDDLYDFEDKLLREWIEHLIKRYNANIQSSGESTKYIQRIARRNRMRASTTTTQKHESVAPLPIYPFLFNPYYYSTVYSSYIPLPYDESTRLIPISQLPYPLIFTTQFPHGSTHMPNNKNPVHMQTYFPPINQIETQKYDKPEEITLRENTTGELLNQNNNSDDFNHTLPTEFHHKEPENEPVSEKPDPKRDQTLHDNTNQFPHTMTTELNRINESRDIQQPLSSIDVFDSDAFTPFAGVINSSIAHNTTSTPISVTTSEIFNLPDIFRNAVSQIPWNAKYNLSSDESSKVTRFNSQSTTTRIPLLSSTKERTETTTETQSVTNRNNESGETSIVEEEDQLNEPREDLPQLKSSNNVDTTTLESSTEIVDNPTKVINTTNNSETVITLLPTSPYSTTTVLSTSLCENNDCQTSKSSPVTTPGIITLHANYSYNSSAQTESAYSTKINNEYVSQPNLISPSTNQFPTSITNSETTIFPYTSSEPSTITLPSSTSFPEVFTSFKLSNSIKDFNKTKEIQSTSSIYTTLYSMPQPISTITSLSSTSSPEIFTSFKSSNSIKDFNKTDEIQSKSLINTTLPPPFTTTSLSSTPSPEVLTSFKHLPSNSMNDSNKNNGIHSTALFYTTLISTLQPLNSTTTVTSSMFTEMPTEQTPSTSASQSITINYDNFTTNSIYSTNIPIYYDETTTSPSILNLVNRNNFPQPENNVQNNLPSDVNNSSKSYPEGLHLTQKTIMRRNDKTHHNFPVSTVERKRISSKPIATPITPRNSIQRKLPLVTISNNLKHRKSTNDRNRVTPKTKSPSQTYRDSELWYNHMYTQKPYKKELSEGQIDFLLKKIIKLLKPEIEKQMVTKESMSRLVVPKLGDQEKLIQIILPMVRDAAKSIENEEPVKINEKQ